MKNSCYIITTGENLPQLSYSGSETNQKLSGRLTFKNILIRALDSTHAKYITIVTSIYLTVQLIAILTGKEIVVPEPIRFPTILIALILAIVYISNNIYTNAIKRIIDENEELKGQNKELMGQVKQLAEPKNPDDLIIENLSYRDIDFAIDDLTKKLTDSKFLVYTDNSRTKIDTEKNIIIGIDRGGAIVGGLLGKRLGLAVTVLAVYYSKFPQTIPGIKTSIIADKCLKNIDFSCVEKIILVDDAIRAGRAIETAVKILGEEKKAYNFEYKIVCVLNVIYRRHIVPDFFTYKTRDINLKLPWYGDLALSSFLPDKKQ